MPSENYNEVLMWTYWPYSSSYCGEAVPLQHDHYRGGKWLRNVDIFPEKMTNLHGSKLILSAVSFQLTQIVIRLRVESGNICKSTIHDNQRV